MERSINGDSGSGSTGLLLEPTLQHEDVEIIGMGRSQGLIQLPGKLGLPDAMQGTGRDRPEAWVVVSVSHGLRVCLGSGGLVLGLLLQEAELQPGCSNRGVPVGEVLQCFDGVGDGALADL